MQELPYPLLGVWVSSRLGVRDPNVQLKRTAAAGPELLYPCADAIGWCHQGTHGIPPAFATAIDRLAGDAPAIETLKEREVWQRFAGIRAISAGGQKPPAVIAADPADSKAKGLREPRGTAGNSLPMGARWVRLKLQRRAHLKEQHQARFAAVVFRQGGCFPDDKVGRSAMRATSSNALTVSNRAALWRTGRLFGAAPAPC